MIFCTSYNLITSCQTSFKQNFFERGNEFAKPLTFHMSMVVVKLCSYKFLLILLNLVTETILVHILCGCIERSKVTIRVNTLLRNRP